MIRASTRPVSLRRSILSNMLALVGLFAAAMLGTTFLAANWMAANLSRTVIDQTLARADDRVRSFIAPVENALDLLASWTEQGHLDRATGRGAEELLLPVLSQFDQLYGAMVIGPGGDGMTLARHQAGTWRLTLVDGDPDTEEAALRFLPGDPDWTTVNYPFFAPSRPWYEGAIESDTGSTFWTTAYKFYLSEQPGITAARRIVIDGESWVIAFDVLLEDISNFTRHIDVGHHGLVLVTDDVGQVIGLPSLPRFEDETARANAYLKRPHELEIDLATDASRAFQPTVESVVDDPVRFASSGQLYWGQGRWIPLNNSREIWAGVLVPEAQLLAGIHRLRWLIVIVALVMTCLAVLRAMTLATRYSEPIRGLARNSLRYASGNLDPAPPVESRIKELRQLANAHERMRTGLENLLKLEDDLQLARQIQQKTFPTNFPASSRFEISAGSRPADATGGDTFDVIGVRQQGDTFTLVDAKPERIFCILADATGHGVGPALTASQVRAMFRMGVRLGNPLGRIGCEMNDQLTADSHGGRFVTALLAEVDVAAGEVHMLSAGQAPILVYRASQNVFEELGADGPPLGVVPTSGDPPQPRVIQLDRGDVIAILSDGVYEARSPQGEQFGQDRVEALIRSCRDRSMNDLMLQLRDDIDAFADGQPVGDDQTGIVIRRK